MQNEQNRYISSNVFCPQLKPKSFVYFKFNGEMTGLVRISKMRHILWCIFKYIKFKLGIKIFGKR